MEFRRRERESEDQGFLVRLARDKRGNVLVLGTAALIPLAGMVGGALDISRLYITKTRLQHACDAGALAGRKAMGAGVWTQNDSMPQTTALQFFDGNFGSGAYGSDTLQREYMEQAGKVSGTASVRVPMTLMKIFNKPTETLSVSCEAEMRLPNTDVMFVLDVTGSMKDKATSTDSETKIEAMRSAVRCFYEIVARLDTKATCVTGIPSGGTGEQVQIRFGFVPYSSNVNVGKLLSPTYFANSWEYQSRKFVKRAWDTWSYYGSYSARSSEACPPSYTNTPTYQYRFRNRDGSNVCHYEGRKLLTFWNYGPTSIPLSGLKDGSGWKKDPSFQLQIGNDGAMRKITWEGCIEERFTVSAANYLPIPGGARDLDIDLVPDQGNIDTLWKPALPQVIYLRRMTGGSDYGQLDGSVVEDAMNYSNSVGHSCPAQASKLVKWDDATEFDEYVDTLEPTGNTYHDIGMIWGARLMSPTGIFRADNAATDRGGSIERHLIFMTDGDAVSQACDYSAYGVAFFDQRTTTDVGSAANCGYVNGGRPALNAQVNSRLEGLCTAVKNMNITLWVISFGNGSNAATEKRLKDCATNGRSFTARDSAALQSTFKAIADQISMLRLTS